MPQYKAIKHNNIVYVVDMSNDLTSKDEVMKSYQPYPGTVFIPNSFDLIYDNEVIRHWVNANIYPVLAESCQLTSEFLSDIEKYGIDSKIELIDGKFVVKTEQLESEQSSISKTITNTSITMISSNLKQLLTTAFNLGITSITIDASQLEDAVKWSLPEDDVDYITFHRGNSKPDIAIALTQCSTATTEQPIWKDWYMTKNYHA